MIALCCGWRNVDCRRKISGRTGLPISSITDLAWNAKPCREWMKGAHPVCAQRLRAGRHRQAEGDRRAAPGGALYPDALSVRFEGELAKGQPQAAAASHLAAPDKLSEQTALDIGRDA